MPEGSLRRRLARGIAWSFLGTAVQSGAGLVVGIGLGRILGVVSFGEWSLVNSTIATLGIFAGLGVGMTATKYVAELRDSDVVRLGRILSLLQRVVVGSAAALTVGLLAIAPILSRVVLQAPHLEDEFRIACLLLFATTLLGLETGILAGLEAFRALAAVSLLRAAIAIPLTLAGALILGVAGALLAVAGTTTVAWICTVLISRRLEDQHGIRRESRGAFTERAVLWQFSLPALLASVMVAPPMWLANVILVSQPEGFRELGAFAAANQWRMAVTFLPSVVGATTLPILSSVFATHRGSALRILSGSIGLSTAAAAPVAALIILASGFVMRLSGADFGAYGDVLTIVGITSVIIAAQLPIGSMIAATGRMWLGVLMNMGWSIIFLGSAFVLIELGWGAIGLAYAYLVAYIVHSLWSFAYVLLVRRDI